MPWDQVVKSESIPVRDLKPGDVIDLEGDPIADGPCVDPNSHDEHALNNADEDECQENRKLRHRYEYGVVVDAARETEECIRLDFRDDDSYGFPVDHELTRVGHDTDYDLRMIRVSQVSSEGTIATAIGVDTKTGERLAFHGDSRMLRNVADAIEEAETEDDLPVCSVEDWQLA